MKAASISAARRPEGRYRASIYLSASRRATAPASNPPIMGSIEVSKRLTLSDIHADFREQPGRLRPTFRFAPPRAGSKRALVSATRRARRDPHGEDVRQRTCYSFQPPGQCDRRRFRGGLSEPSQGSALLRWIARAMRGDVETAAHLAPSPGCRPRRVPDKPGRTRGAGDFSNVRRRSGLIQRLTPPAASSRALQRRRRASFPGLPSKSSVDGGSVVSPG
jgi:hypothetical protein